MHRFCHVARRALVRPCNTLYSMPTLVSKRTISTCSYLLNKKILISDPIEDVCVDILREAGYEVDCKEKVPPNELIEMIKNYDGLIVRSGTQVTKEVLLASNRLKIIGRAGTGVDNIDVDVATKCGKLVMNTPGGNTASAAELTLSLLLSLCRNIPNATTSMKSGKWERKKFMGTELSGKTIGIIGLGQIGRRVAKSCRGLGMITVGYDPLLSSDVASDEDIKLMSVEDVLKQSDFISFHVPLNNETKNLLNIETFKLCKKGVFIINAARGGIIDDDALLANLNSGHVAGAAMDVYRTEPPPTSLQVLLDHPNVVCTPHLGASTGEAQEKVASEIASQMVDAMEGRRISGVVNAKILSEMHAKPELQDWVDLAERLGNLHSQLLTGNLHQITLVTRGKILKKSSNLLVASALKGILSPMVMESVNFINAPVLAKEFGLNITQVHENVPSLYGNSITIHMDTDMDSTGMRDNNGKVRRSLVGTVNNKSPRIMKIDDLEMEITPEGHLLFFTNKDKSGVISKVSSVLAKHDINIGSFVLGRSGAGGNALGCMSLDATVNDEILEEIANVAKLTSIQSAYLSHIHQLKEGQSITDDRPEVKPSCPNFSSGPTKKYPGFDISTLDVSTLGRSHRSIIGKRLIKTVIDMQREILQIPDDYKLMIVPASDTGAMEMMLWSLLSNSRNIDVVHFDSFGKGWFNDIKNELGLASSTIVNDISTDIYGTLPDLTHVNNDNDIIFTWNGTTSGVKIPNADWIHENRTGLTICDATSAVFAMDIPWKKLDVATYSWQKALGGEAAHGVVILSPRAIERLELNEQPRGLPKIFKLTKSNGKFNDSIAEGNVINTVSMLCIEDVYSSLKWVKHTVGGLAGMIKRSENNLQILERFVEQRSWIDFLAADKNIRSNTSVCLKFNDFNSEQVKEFVKLLNDENIAYDINSYKSAPVGIRIWCGATIEGDDIEKLTLWLDWAYNRVANN